MGSRRFRSPGSEEGVVVTVQAMPCPEHPWLQLRRIGLDDLPRIARLRRELLAAKPAVCVERARLVTEYLRRHGLGRDRAVLRQARVLGHVLDHLPTTVFDDELIVGATTRHRLGCMVFPEMMGAGIWPELTSLSTRAHDPVALSREDASTLARDVFPFWCDHTVHEHARRRAGDSACIRLSERIVFYLLSKANCISHVIPSFAMVLEHGMARIAEDATRRAAEATDAETRELHQACALVASAVLRFSERYALACEEAALSASLERARELREIARVLRRVPAQPARTLHEALQAIWLIQVALHQENNDVGMSIGRLDQLLGPLYRDDLTAGRQDPQSACELLASFFLKLGDHTPLIPAAAHELVGGSATNQAVTIGGLTPAGQDAVNDATYLILAANNLLRLREPNLCARLHATADATYRRALSESIYRTGASPALYGDEAVIDALEGQGMRSEDARDYGIVGCVEASIPGRTMGMTGAILFNLASVLELALNDGVHPLSGLRIGPATGELRRFGSFAEVERAFVTQLEHMTGLATEGNALLAEAHAELHPTPLLSALVEGTATSGRDVTRGGARYNSSGVAIIGLADVADSLTALRALVFADPPLLDAARVHDALQTDFVDDERVRVMLLRKAPKYGQDDHNADGVAAWLVERIDTCFAAHAAPRDGNYRVGYWSMTMHAGLGALTGSLPNGRRRGAPLASGGTPVAGVSVAGPTASLASTAKLPARHMANGIALNHKLSRALLAQRGKLALLDRLVQTYFARGGMQVQYTVHDRRTLLAAQVDPESHRDLLVRVSGYTAYFCELNRRMQDEIIGRTEDRL
jgi:pyruvate formate-lyase/glycerol dehydratase family glycyl radical enzyme